MTYYIWLVNYHFIQNHVLSNRHLRKSLFTFSGPFVYVCTRTLSCIEKTVQVARASKLRFLLMIVDVNTNSIGSIKWTCRKEGNFANIFFSKFCFSLKTSYLKLICSNYSNIHIYTFRKHWSFILEWRLIKLTIDRCIH